MTDRTRNGHPTDLELAAWVDEPEVVPDLSAHLETCALCRDRAAELSATRAGIAIDPPMPTDAAFAAQRQRIMAAIEEAPRVGSGRVIRRIGWLVPLAAAAGIGAIVLIDQPDGSPPGAASATVVAEAEAAAQEAATIPVAEQELDAALAAAGGLTPSASIERSAIEAEFTLLSEAEQSAVLRELERSDFDL